MKIHQAEYVTSSVKLDQCPEATMPEYAFIGRSNVGKSSLINMLTARRKLAKVSGAPGKTITINHFIIDNAWYLVDLPGYGYAKRSKSERAKWQKMIRSYLLNRPNLMTVFLLIDIRHEPQNNDLEFMKWLAVSQIPFTIVFTKADKLKAVQTDKNLSVYKKNLLRDWEALPEMIITSATKSKGREELLSFIESTNKLFVK